MRLSFYRFIYAGLLLFPVFFGTPSGAQSLHYEQFLSENGLAGERVYTVFSDSKGFLWFGTDQGVSRYDGKKFMNLTTHDGLADNDVFLIDEDPKGNIWFGTFSSSLSYYNGDSLIQYEFNRVLDAVLPNRSVKLGFYFSKDGDLFLSDQQYALIRIDNQGNIKKYGGYECNLFDFGDKVLVGQLRNTGNDRFRKIQGFRLYDVQNDFKILDSSFYQLPENKAKGSHYSIKTGTGSYILAKAEYLWHIGPNGSDFIETKLKIDCIFKDNMGRYYLGTHNHGLYVFKDEKLTDTLAHFFDGWTITSLANDFQGGLWISTLGNGAIHFPKLDERDYRDRGLPNSIFNMLSAGPNNRVMAMKASGEIFIMNDNNWARLPLIPGFDETDRPYMFYDNQQNELLVKGYLMKGKTLEGFKLRSLRNRPEVNPQSYLFSIKKRGDQILEIRGKGIYSSKIGNLLSAFTDIKGLNSISATEVHRDTLWLATNLGIYTLNSENEIQPMHLDFFSKRVIRDMVSFSDMLLIASTDGHIYVRKPKGDFVIGPESSVPLGINKLAVDEDLILWIGTNNGLYYYDLINGDNVHKLSAQSGSWESRINDLMILEDQIFVAGATGVEYFNRRDILQDTIIPPRLYAGIKRVNSSPSFSFGSPKSVFEYSENNIDIGFIPVSYADKGGSVIEWRFIGENSGWRQLEGDVISFNELPPGLYQIEARVSDLPDVWSKISTVQFKILPAWWQRNDVRATGLAMIIALTALSFYQRVKYLSSKARKELELLREKSDLEMRALRAQMNPHFIFNALTSIQYLISEKKSDEAEFYLNKFSRLLRMVVDKAGQEEVTLMEELDLLRIYIDLENLRYDNKIDFDLELADSVELDQVIIPAMVIQPFIENAVEHGLSKLPGRGKLMLEVRIDNNLLKVIISDNGIGREKARELKAASGKSKVSVGVYNVRRRISLLNDQGDLEKYKLEIEDMKDPEGRALGTKVFLTLPLKQST